MAPPARPGEWTLVFADSAVAKGWEQLSKQYPGPLRSAWEILIPDPRSGAPPNRMHRLKADLKTRIVGGVEHERWQYEITGGGRIWYCIDDRRTTLHLTYAGTGHPSRTGR